MSFEKFHGELVQPMPRSLERAISGNLVAGGETEQGECHLAVQDGLCFVISCLVTALGCQLASQPCPRAAVQGRHVLQKVSL